jgi:hypothetical protein
VAGGHQDPERVLAEQQRCDLRRGERGPADPDVQPAVGQLPVLLGHAGLDLVDHQAGVAGLDLVQDLQGQSSSTTAWPTSQVAAVSGGWPAAEPPN